MIIKLVIEKGKERIIERAYGKRVGGGVARTPDNTVRGSVPKG